MQDLLTPQNLKAAPEGLLGSPAIDLDQIQGDVLIGLQKVFEQFIFFEIKDTSAFKTALRQRIARRITTTRTVQLREFQLRDHKSQGGKNPLPNVGVNLAFTNEGINKLVLGANLNDPSFAMGAKQQTNVLGDPVDANGNPTTWVPQFLSAEIDGVYIITGGTHTAINDEVTNILAIFGAAIQVCYDETGSVRPGLEKGHEHFGWLDGVSQPAIKGLTDPFPGQRLLQPGLFVFGYSPNSEPPLPWMKNGSFLVFRRLKQLVPEFDQFILTQAQSLGMDPVLLGARLVGRWKSGAPLTLTPSQDDSAMGPDPLRNNNFDFSDDQAERRCPFGAHIRKTNPRADLLPEEDDVDPHRIIRAGIPFGPEVNGTEAQTHVTQEDRGLMFLCYQVSIPKQFEFVQISWANNPGFIFGKKHPDGSAVVTGFDPIIGQNAGKKPNDPPARARFTDEPVSNYPVGNLRSRLDEPSDFIITTAAAYLFVPSIEALENELSA